MKPFPRQAKKVSWSFFSRKDCLLLLLITHPATATEDPIIAQRGQDRITLSQARALDPETRKTPAALSEALRNLLLQQAILQAAQAQKWDRRPDIAALARRAHDQAIGQSFLAAQASVPASYPSEAEITAAYEQNKARLMQPRAYHLTQAFIPAKPADQPAARARLQTLARIANRPPATLESAAAHAAGVQFVDLGWLPETQIQPAIKSTIAGLQEGALSDPVCTAQGCHLLRLAATRPAGPAPLAEARAALVAALRQQKQADGERAYANALLARDPVRINEIELSKVAP